jgi:hypothetical protein
VLSVAPMNLARAAYHERSLGRGLDDYYSEWGERPGIWWGGGADLLGLEGYAAPGSIVSLLPWTPDVAGGLMAMRRKAWKKRKSRLMWRDSRDGRCKARTCDPQLVELVLSQLS